MPGGMSSDPGARERVRLVDVAAACGVTKSVASRVLNNDPTLNVRPETRQRILAAAQEPGLPGARRRARPRRLPGARSRAAHPGPEQSGVLEDHPWRLPPGPGTRLRDAARRGHRGGRGRRVLRRPRRGGPGGRAAHRLRPPRAPAAVVGPAGSASARVRQPRGTRLRPQRRDGSGRGERNRGATPAPARPHVDRAGVRASRAAPGPGQGTGLRRSDDCARDSTPAIVPASPSPRRAARERRRSCSRARPLRPPSTAAPSARRSAHCTPSTPSGCGCRRTCPSSPTTTCRLPIILDPPLTTVAMPLLELGALAVDAVLSQLGGAEPQDVAVPTKPAVVARASTGSNRDRARSGGCQPASRSSAP